jgi:hypothetical protein
MENAEKFKKIFRGILSVGQRKSEDALRSLQTQIQDFVQGRKTAEEFMEEMTKALEVENSHTVILKFLENTSFSCETTYSLERSKLRTSSNHPSGSPPLRTQSFLLSSAQLSSTESRRGIWLGTEAAWVLVTVREKAMATLMGEKSWRTTQAAMIKNDVKTLEVYSQVLRSEGALDNFQSCAHAPPLPQFGLRIHSFDEFLEGTLLYTNIVKFGRV